MSMHERKDLSKLFEHYECNYYLSLSELLYKDRILLIFFIFVPGQVP